MSYLKGSPKKGASNGTIKLIYFKHHHLKGIQNKFKTKNVSGSWMSDTKSTDPLLNDCDLSLTYGIYGHLDHTCVGLTAIISSVNVSLLNAKIFILKKWKWDWKEWKWHNENRTQ